MVELSIKLVAVYFFATVAVGISSAAYQNLKDTEIGFYVDRAHTYEPVKRYYAKREYGILLGVCLSRLARTDFCPEDIRQCCRYDIYKQMKYCWKGPKSCSAAPVFPKAPNYPKPPSQPRPIFKPSPTFKPRPAVKPRPTFKPVPTFKPKPTFRPRPTFKPVPAFKPKPTFKPRPTYRPKPIQTKAPKTRPTKKPAEKPTQRPIKLSTTSEKPANQPKPTNKQPTTAPSTTPAPSSTSIPEATSSSPTTLAPSKEDPESTAEPNLPIALADDSAEDSQE